MDFVLAQAPGVVVIISLDTTWTKTGSPYELTGPLLVNEGVTLTIESGAVVNLNGYDVKVDGAVVAIGNSNEKVHIFEEAIGEPDVSSFGRIEFTQNSIGWNKQTGAGSIIEHAFIENVDLDTCVSIKISNSVIRGDITVGDSSILVDNEIGIINNISSSKITLGSSSSVSNNELVGSVYAGDSNLFQHNAIKGSINAGDSNAVTENSIEMNVFVGNSCSILNNKINGIVEATDSEISNNIIEYIVSYPRYAVMPGVTPYRPPGPAIEVTGDSLVSNNKITCEGYDGIVVVFGPSHVFGNTITDAKTGIIATRTNNENYDGIDDAGVFLIFENIITNAEKGIGLTCDATVDGNLLLGCETGITYICKYAAIRNNTIADGGTGIIGYGHTGGSATIERNFILNNTVGVEVGSQVTIQNNTITDTDTAIILGDSPSVSINQNNIENYTKKSLQLRGTLSNVDATNNWWGTTDTQAINMTIHDYKFEFNLGKVDFVPFLTEPNPEATSTIPEFPSWIVLPLFLIATILIIVSKIKLTKIN